MENELSLPEKLYLLNIHPEKGGLANTAGLSLDYTLIGACLTEMLEDGNIKTTDGRITVVSAQTQKVISGIILQKFERTEKPLKIGRWINRIHNSLSHIKKTLKSGLEKKRLIRLESRKFLFFRWQRPYLLEKMLVREIVSSISSAIYSGEIPAGLKGLLPLIEPANLMWRIFPEKQSRKAARQKLKRMNLDNEISEAVKRAIATTRAAVAS